MRILMVLSDNTYPPDIRVRKEASALIKAGHELYLICRNKGKQKRKENVNGIRVTRINLRQEFIVDHIVLFFIVFLNILQISRKEKIDVIHVHDIPLAYPSIIAGKVLGKKIIIDLHENYAAMIEYAGPVKRKSKPISVIAGILGRIEVLACNLSDIVIVVVKEAVDRLEKEGVDSSKFKIISNHADLDRLNNEEAEAVVLRKPALVYSGGLSLHRGMDTLLDALASIKNDWEFYLYIVGGMKEELKKIGLEEKIRTLGLEDRVIMTGWIPFDESIEYVKGGDILLIPHHKNPHTEATIPHKIFQFMYLKKPVIVSDVGPLKEVVEGTGCGAVFKAGDIHDLAKKIIHMLDHQEQWSQMGDIGHKAVIDKYNWSMESRKLLELYYQLR